MAIPTVGRSPLDYGGGCGNPSRARPAGRQRVADGVCVPIIRAGKTFGPAAIAALGRFGPTPIPGRRLARLDGPTGRDLAGRPPQPDRQPAVGRGEPVPVVLITLDAPLEPFDRLVPNGEATEVVECPIGVIAILGLEPEDLVLEAGVLPCATSDQALRLLESRSRHHGAARQTRGDDEGQAATCERPCGASESTIRPDSFRG